MTAIISPCGLYRYRLERDLAPKMLDAPTLLVVMVNPSTADAEKDDATIRKLIGFGSRWSMGRLIVGNLFAYRSTDVRALATASDPVGPENDTHLLEMMREADRLVVAWGPKGKLPRRLRTRYRRVLEMAHLVSRRPMSIGKPAKDGHPRHPLMLAYSTELQPWSPPL